MRAPVLLLFACTMGSVPFAAGAEKKEDEKPALSFDRDILPIFRAKCIRDAHILLSHRGPRSLPRVAPAEP